MKYFLIVLLLNLAFNYDVIECDSFEDVLDLVNSIEMQRASQDDPEVGSYVNLPNDHPISYDEENELNMGTGLMDSEPNDLNKRFYVQVIRKYCSRSQPCLGVKGRHRYSTCTCMGRKQCRRALGGYRCY